MPLFERDALEAKSLELEARSPEEILTWAVAEYERRVGISTAFGVEGCVLVDMVSRLGLTAPVFTIDTDFLFPETLELAKRLEERYGIEIRRYSGEVSKEEQDKLHGLALYARDPDRCCALRKVEPMRRALVPFAAWVTGLRRDQGPSRKDIEILERYDHDDGSPLIKVNPLARWSRTDTWAYVAKYGVPYNPLLDQGYKSVGCWPCTQPVSEGDDERAGRWAGTGKAECGIHTFLERKG